MFTQQLAFFTPLNSSMYFIMKCKISFSLPQATASAHSVTWPALQQHLLKQIRCAMHQVSGDNKRELSWSPCALHPQRGKDVHMVTKPNHFHYICLHSSFTGMFISLNTIIICATGTYFYQEIRICWNIWPSCCLGHLLFQAGSDMIRLKQLLKAKEKLLEGMGILIACRNLHANLMCIRSACQNTAYQEAP